MEYYPHAFAVHRLELPRLWRDAKAGNRGAEIWHKIVRAAIDGLVEMPNERCYFCQRVFRPGEQPEVVLITHDGMFELGTADFFCATCGTDQVVGSLLAELNGEEPAPKN